MTYRHPNSLIGRQLTTAASASAARTAIGAVGARVVAGAGIDLTGATNSDTAFQAILNAAAADAAAGDGTIEVYIPPGTLSLTTRPTVGAGVTIRGAGLDATTVRSSNTLGVFQLIGASDITISDLTAQSTATGTSSIPIVADFSTGVQKRVTVTRCRITGSTNNAVRFPWAIEQLTFTDNLVEDCVSGVAIYAPTVASGLNSRQIVLSRNRFLRVGSVQMGVNAGVNFIPGSDPPVRIFKDANGKTISNVFDVEVSGNQLRDFIQGTFAGPIPLEFCGVTNLRIVNNTIDGPAIRGISTGFNMNMVIAGNTIRDQERYAVELNGGQRISIVGNTVENCETLATETGDPAVADFLSDVVIANNTYFGSGRTATRDSDVIALRNAKRVRITGNIFHNWQHLRSAVRIGNATVPPAEDVVVESNTFVISDPNTPILTVNVRSAIRTSIVRNTIRINRNLVTGGAPAGDDAVDVIRVTPDALTSDTYVADNDIMFTGTVAAAPDAAGIGTAGQTTECPRLFVSGNRVVNGPRGLRLTTSSTDLVVYDNETSTCAGTNVIPATVSLTRPPLTSPRINKVLDTNGADVLTFTANASPTTNVNVRNHANTPTIESVGTPSDVSLSIVSKGTSSIFVSPGNTSAAQFSAVTSAVNFLRISGGTAGNPATIFATGSDGTVNLNFTTKGGGTVQANGVVLSTNSVTSVHTAQQIELGHASDTTIARASAGVVTIEGNTVATRLTGTATLDFGSVTAQSQATLTMTVTGAVAGDAVALGVPTAAVISGIDYTAWVSAADTVTVRAANYSAGSLDPASGVFRATIIR
jgi:hypothetical protein